MKTNLVILVIICSQVLINCSGCSESGLRSKQNKRDKNITKEHVEPVIKPNNQEQIQQINSDSQLSNTINLSLQELFRKYKSAVFMVYTSDGNSRRQGSGFFITPDGIGVSNYHVFEGTNKGLEAIIMDTGEEFKISEVIAANKEKDFIFFKVALNRSNNYFEIASSPSEIGDQVFAIGNPEGLEHTLSTGIISGFRENNLLIQTTTEITHGSSGGPLINMDGHVIGITAGGLNDANLNFAINLQAILEE